jgi:hypothetical protein
MALLAILALLVPIVVGCYGLFIGNKPLLEVLRNVGKRVRKKDKPHLPRTGVCELAEANKAVNRRTSYDSTLRDYARTTRSKATQPVKEYLDSILATTTRMTDSVVSSNALSDSALFVDCIGSLLDRSGRRILILPSYDSSPDVEGVGRTSLILGLLGITFRYGKMIGLSEKELKKMGEIPYYKSKRTESWCHLIAMDMIYLGTSNGKLCVIPTVGEKLSAIWDFARHVYRTTELEYGTGKHRQDGSEGRDRLYSIFHRIPLETIFDHYGPTDTVSGVDEVILLKRNREEFSMPTKRKLDGDERLEQLEKAINVPTRHDSLFWARDAEQDSIINAIIGNLDKRNLPSVYEIAYSCPGGCTPHYLYKQLAKKVMGTEEKIDIHEDTSWVGISQHNFELFKSLETTPELHMLLTSGEKLFKDVCFWNILLRNRKFNELKAIMLEPGSPAANDREKSAYPDFESGELSVEIQNNMDTIFRMNRFFRKNDRPVDMEVYTIDRLPAFRITFTGKDRVIVASYVADQRTDSKTCFFEVDELKQGFRRFYQETLGSAEKVKQA